MTGVTRFVTATITCLVLAGMQAGSAAHAQDQDKARSLGDLTGPWQLLVDDFLIAEKHNVRRTYHAFERHPENPVAIMGENGVLGGRGTVLPMADGAGFIYYMNFRGTVSSPDLVQWGNRRSADPEATGGNASVLHTPWEKGREYKMVTYQGGEEGYQILGFYSSDGISSWKPIEPNPLMPGSGDTLRFVWDPVGKQYYGTMKIWTDVRGTMRRSVGLATSRTFDSGWSDAQMILIPDTVDDQWVTEPGQGTQFYSFSAFAYETMYIGLVERFRLTDGLLADRLSRLGPNEGPIEIELLTSRDGVHWDRISDREAILPSGRMGSWDAGLLKLPTQPVVHDGKIQLMYQAGFYTHGYGRNGYPTRGLDKDKENGFGLATLRKDGWASLDAGRHEGSVTTHVMRNVQGPLALNFITARGTGYGTGWIKVELLDENGRVIPGYSRDDADAFRGNSLDQVVTWKGSDTLPKDRPLRVRFVMTDAQLYSFRAGAEVRVDAEVPPLKVVHTFEQDGDRVPGIHFQNDVAVDRDPQHAAFGRASAVFAKGPDELVYERGKPRPPLRDDRGNGMELDNTFQLGSQFTLAAQVRTPDRTTRQRLFSSFDPYPERTFERPHERTGWIGKRELVMDFQPDGAGDAGMLRLVVHGQEVIAAGSFSPGQYQHLAATYDDGQVRLYLNGELVTEQRVDTRGPVHQLVNLRVGTDSGPFSDQFQGRARNHQLVGHVDDLVVYGRALAQDQIRRLHRQGATAFFRLQQ